MPASAGSAGSRRTIAAGRSRRSCATGWASAGPSWSTICTSRRPARGASASANAAAGQRFAGEPAPGCSTTNGRDASAPAAPSVARASPPRSSAPRAGGVAGSPHRAGRGWGATAGPQGGAPRRPRGGPGGGGVGGAIWGPPTSTTGEQGQRGVVQTSVRCERVAGVDRRHAFEVGEPASRLLDDDLARRQVPRLEIDFHVDLGLPLGDERITQVVAEAALTLRRVDEPHEAVPDTGFAVQAQSRVQQ